MHTLFCEAEAIVNSRPLTLVSADVKDLKPITPNNLLNLGNSPVVVGHFSESDSYSRRRWRQVQYMAEQFWIRWKQEYMTTLQKRQKWVKEHRNVSIGDIVMVVDENTARAHWPLGKVQDVKLSRDNKVRSVVVRLADKVLTRPISKLVLILEDEFNVIGH